MTQRKAITFLGTSNYQETDYEYQQQRCKTPYFAVALAEMFKPDVMLVVMTTEAREKHWHNLQSQLANQGTQICEIDIPTGKTEDDLWEIFTLMAKQIDHGDRLIFDITHSFRSQPLLVLLVAGFVRVIKTDVEVEKLIYGAFEAKTDNIAPVFDLTPFVTLLDWTTATEMFLQTGYASPLTTLVKQETKRTVQPSAPVSDKTTGRPEPRVLLTGAFKEVSTQLETLAEALRCGRPLEVMEGATSLSSKLKKLQDQLDQVERSFATQPFVLLLEQIAQQFEPLALSKPLEKSQYPENLHRQQVLLRWYLDHEQPVQAITLARELMVSQRLLEDEATANLLKSEHRERAEKHLNEEARQSSPGKIGKLWDRLGKLRNDVAHVGMRENRGKVKDILINVRQVCEDLLLLLEKDRK